MVQSRKRTISGEGLGATQVSIEISSVTFDNREQLFGAKTQVDANSIRSRAGFARLNSRVRVLRRPRCKCCSG